ncbi:hypothetical protein BY996DRAFT_6474177 [Phakopsora pachyrhizi]|nr:hypothetical protein BY996DRAFT_6474177 [Phakopsora pachyrhizi]
MEPFEPELLSLENYSMIDRSSDEFFTLNNSRSAPSTDLVVMESESKGYLKVDHKPCWVEVPLDAVDKSITREFWSIITEKWVRDKLTVMEAIQEETIQMFMKLFLHPSTLAPLVLYDCTKATGTPIHSYQPRALPAVAAPHWFNPTIPPRQIGNSKHVLPKV